MAHLAEDDPAVIGLARVDRRTKNLLLRIRPGEIAIIDHADLDRVAAEGLIEAGVVAVVNGLRSVTGRYPNVGPLLIAAAGIPLVDDVGPDVLDEVGEGQLLRVEGDEVLAGGRCLATGVRQSLRSLEEDVEAAKLAMGDELERFATNTLAYLREEQHLLTDSPDLPELRTRIKGRHVLVVVRGLDYREDLAALRSY